MTDCIIFPGYKDKNGYGWRQYLGRREAAHRAAYMEFVGEIPPEYEVDHLCFNTSCVNPEHLEAVTHAVNMQRAFKRYYSRCSRNHEPNFWVDPKTNKKKCRDCGRENKRKEAARKKAMA